MNQRQVRKHHLALKIINFKSLDFQILFISCLSTVIICTSGKSLEGSIDDERDTAAVTTAARAAKAFFGVRILILFTLLV